MEIILAEENLARRVAEFSGFQTSQVKGVCGNQSSGLVILLMNRLKMKRLPAHEQGVQAD